MPEIYEKKLNQIGNIEMFLVSTINSIEMQQNNQYHLRRYHYFSRSTLFSIDQNYVFIFNKHFENFILKKIGRIAYLLNI